MNNKPTCHPENPESGQQWLTEEQKTALLDAAIEAERMVRHLWRAYYASKYDDHIITEGAIDEARIYQYIVRNKIKQLPPSTSFPANAIPEK